MTDKLGQLTDTLAFANSTVHMKMHSQILFLFDRLVTVTAISCNGDEFGGIYFLLQSTLLIVLL